MAERTLAESALSGWSWQVGAQFGVGVAQVGTTAVLAHMLLPGAFGTVTLAMIFVSLVTGIGGESLSIPLVRTRNLTSSDLRVAWTVAIAGAVVGAGGIAVGAPFLGTLLGSQAVTPVLQVLSVHLPIAAVRICPEALLKIAMDFRKLAIAQTVSFVVGYVLIGIPLALAGRGVWALVAASLAQAAIGSTALALWVRPPIRPLLDKKATKELLGYGGIISAASLTNFVALNGDFLVVGRVLGESALGLYSRAYSLMTLPLQYVAQVASTVLLPAYSQAQDDMERLRRAYVTTVNLVFMAATPIMITLTISARPLILVLFGSAWAKAVLPFQVLSIVGPFRATYNVAGPLARATGRARGEFRRQVGYALLVLFGASLGSFWGLEGVAVGVAVAILAMYVFMADLALRIVGANWLNFATAHFGGAVLGTASGSGALLALLCVKLAGQGNYVSLAASILGSSVGLLIAFRIGGRRLMYGDSKRVVEMLGSRLPSRLARGVMKLFH